MPPDRYYVTELHGYTSPHRTSRPGCSYTVHDRLELCRPVAVFRTEETKRIRGYGTLRREHAFAVARARAYARCAELNAQ